MSGESAVEVQAYAGRIVTRQDGRNVAEHWRKFRRGEAVAGWNTSR